MKDPQKVKVELPYDSAIMILGIHPKETKRLSQQYICTPMFIATLFIIAKNRE